MVTPEDVRRVPMFAKVEDEGLQWLCDSGDEVWLEAGQTLREEGQPADHVFLILDGAIRITQRVGNQEEILITHNHPTIFGEVPVLMGTPFFWASSRAIRRTHVLELPVALFWQLLGRCPVVTTEIMRTMAERVQSVQALTQQRERLASLGTLAAGLAHELNNPAAAARRAAHQLGDVLSASRVRACKLKASDWTKEQRHYVTELQDQISHYCRITNALDPLVQSDREQEVADWLDSHVIAASWELAPTLVSAGFDCAKLDDVATHIPASSLEDALYWIGAGATVDGLVAEIQTSAERIGSLVDAMKSYTYLDRGDQQEVDVREGLESTIAILGAKLNDVEIIREYAPDVPRICAYGSELNQVWSHLLTNAADAMRGQRNLNAPERANGHSGDTPRTENKPPNAKYPADDCGKIWIRTINEGNNVCVEIADNGPGITSEEMTHIFEPFFTTKDIGLGTGMGLVVSRRIIVERHGGDMQVHSEPGYTCFEVAAAIPHGGEIMTTEVETRSHTDNADEDMVRSDETARQQTLFPRLTPEQVTRVAEFGTERTLQPGDVLFEEGSRAEKMYVVREGEIKITKRAGGEEATITVHHPGEFTGELSLLMGSLNTASARAITPARVIEIAADALKHLMQECAPIAEAILPAMVSRVKDADILLQQREKMAALGKMAAGLAHELNNPAAAARSATQRLRETFLSVQTQALELHQSALTPDQCTLLRRFAQETEGQTKPVEELDALAQSDAEDELTTWLEDRNVEDAWKLAPTLVAAGIHADALAPLAEMFSGPTLAHALVWLESTLSMNALMSEIEASANRIADLVKAVKEYSYLDKAALAEVDIAKGLDNTLIMLGHKLRNANVQIIRHYQPDLPMPCAYGSELNQVWTNLIDNAIDALTGQPGPCELRISTECEHDGVMVAIEDNGPGIPDDLQSKVFDPFFTTKDVGKGTGLGLDIVYRIVVKKHHGDVCLFSEPGCTRFEIRIPLRQPSVEDKSASSLISKGK